MLCLIGLAIERYRSRRRRAQANLLNADLSLSTEGEAPKEAKHVFSWIFVLPTLCDLGATSLAGIGLLYVPAVRFSL